MGGGADEGADLTGRVALVTGAGSGIGRGAARLLAERGATVTCTDLKEETAAETAKLIAGAGGAASHAGLDVSSEAAVDAMVAQVAADGGHLDIMVNVAGVGETMTAIVDLPTSTVERVLGVNLMGTFFGCRAAARCMSVQRSGAIVNVASSVVDTPQVTGLTAYGMSKAAIVQLTRTLAYELGPVGVRVNAVSPGFILTPHPARHFTSADGVVDEEAREAFLARFRAVSPLGLIGHPEDVAESIAFLASDAARYMTGQILRPNGGQAMPN